MPEDGALLPGQIADPQTLEDVVANAQIDADAEGVRMGVFRNRKGELYYMPCPDPSWSPTALVAVRYVYPSG